jgi:hypothetical protein
VKQKTYSSNSNKARPAATRTTCRPSAVNEIGADLVFPPSERLQTSHPVSLSKAKSTPPDAPNPNVPSVEGKPPSSRKFHAGGVRVVLNWPSQAQPPQEVDIERLLAGHEDQHRKERDRHHAALRDKP